MLLCEIELSMEFESKQLNWYLKNLDKISRDVWLWIPNNTQSLTSQTECYEVDDDVDLSAEEFDERDLELERKGFKSFFNKDQLEDIESNLQQQKKSYNSNDLYLALNYYWNNDAFIDFSHA